MADCAICRVVLGSVISYPLLLNKVSPTKWLKIFIIIHFLWIRRLMRVGWGASLEVRWLRLLASMAGACLLSLIRELKSHMPRSAVAVGGWWRRTKRNLMGIHGASWGRRIDGKWSKLIHTVVFGGLGCVLETIGLLAGYWPSILCHMGLSSMAARFIKICQPRKHWPRDRTHNL